MQNELTKKEQRLMRRWFKITDNNTIELKEKLLGRQLKIVLVLFLLQVFIIIS